MEIAITDMAGNPLMSTLVNPGIPIPDGARAIHGISDDDVVVGDRRHLARGLPRHRGLPPGHLQRLH